MSRMPPSFSGGLLCAIAVVAPSAKNSAKNSANNEATTLARKRFIGNLPVGRHSGGGRFFRGSSRSCRMRQTAASGAASAFLLEHDAVGKPVPTDRLVVRGHAF